MEVQTDVRKIELSELSTSESSGTPLFANSIDLIKNVKVNLTVKLGDADLTVDELFQLENGSIIKLNQNANASVNVLLDDKVIAKGELVVADDNFGVSITEILHY